MDRLICPIINGLPLLIEDTVPNYLHISPGEKRLVSLVLANDYISSVTPTIEGHDATQTYSTLPTLATPTNSPSMNPTKTQFTIDCSSITDKQLFNLSVRIVGVSGQIYVRTAVITIWDTVIGEI